MKKIKEEYEYRLEDIIVQMAPDKETYLWAVNWIKKDFRSVLKSALEKQKQEIISKVCMEIASYNPISIEKTEALLKIIRKI